ncbi:hypothetical protein F4054_02070 [Candidatus Poribacteria bacterium]|nr:hypothetical protein [Candidatus Poribacteria bacterium]MYG08486.1 hypothetical protein [Candidatus Poribacteria bacterium]MYK21028.1 hypothetical protein [Candidatus Poribacteria bacterium]
MRKSYTIYKTTPYSLKEKTKTKDAKAQTPFLSEQYKGNNFSDSDADLKSAEQSFIQEDEEPLLDTFIEEVLSSTTEEKSEVRVSPYGFGPYPEIPEDYPGTEPSWESDLDSLGYSDSDKKDAELLSRVLIRLWADQGVGSRFGGSLDSKTKTVYPYYDNTIYVKRDVLRRDANGKPISFSARIHAPGNMIITAEDLEIFRLTGETPPGVRVLQLETDGIDAYQFLNLQQ